MLTPERRAQIAESDPKDRPKPLTDLDMSAAEIRGYSIARAIRAKLEGKWDRGSPEAEAHRTICDRLGTEPASQGGFYVPYQVQHRADVVAGGSTGGYLVGQQNVGFVDLLRNRSVAFRLGAQLLPGLAGNASIPKLTGAATAYWLGTESTQITEKEQSFGQLALTPKTVGGYTEISRLLLMQSTPAADIVVSRDLSAVVALGLDAAVIAGPGSAGQPAGIVNTAGITSASGSSVNWAALVKLQRTAGDANSSAEAFAYAATPAVAELLANKQRFAGTNSSLWEGPLADGTVAGARAMSSAQVPAATIVAGPWDEIAVGEWGILEIAVNPYANFQSALVGVRAMWTVDVGIRHAATFSVLTNVS